MANETATIPDNLRAKAQEKGWPLDLVQQALGIGATAEQLIGYMDQGVTADQARQFLAAQAGAAAGGAEPSDALKAKAEEHGWPMDLIAQALSFGAAEEDLIRYMDMGVTAEQARQFMMNGGGSGAPMEVDLSWIFNADEAYAVGRCLSNSLACFI